MIDAAVASDGAVWTVDRNAGRLLRIDSAGGVRSVHAGAMRAGQVSGVARGPGEAIWYLLRDGTVGRLDPNGEGATETALAERVGALMQLRRAPDGSLWFLDGARERIGHVAPDGTVRLLEPAPDLTARRPGAGSGGGVKPTWVWPRSMESLGVAPDGALWIGSSQDDALFRIVPDDMLRTRRVDFPSARGHPYAIDVGADGTVWVALAGTQAVGRIAPGATTMREVAVGGRVEHVRAARDGGAWFATSTAVGHVAADGRVRSVDCGRSGGPIVERPRGGAWSLGNQTILHVDTGATRLVATTARRVEASTGTTPAGTERRARSPRTEGTATRTARDPWAGAREAVHPIATTAIDSALAAHRTGYVVLLLTNDDGSCPPCSRMNATYDSLAFDTGRDRQHYLFAEWIPWHAIRGDAVAQRLGLRELPTLIQYHDGKEITRVVGARSLETLKQLLGFNGW
jgi:streptogramin lyase